MGRRKRYSQETDLREDEEGVLIFNFKVEGDRRKEVVRLGDPKRGLDLRICK